MDAVFEVCDRVECLVDHPDNNVDIVIGSLGTVCEIREGMGMEIGVCWDSKIEGGIIAVVIVTWGMDGECIHTRLVFTKSKMMIHSNLTSNLYKNYCLAKDWGQITLENISVYLYRISHFSSFLACMYHIKMFV